jgi:threonylcarbamoyladenosine tRNA methylthiotransferase MtaB
VLPSFFVQNFGCRAAQADGAALESALARDGHTPSASTDAELVILNTCTVTSEADNDLRQSIRRLRRENPAARVLVTGCYAQRAPSEIAALPGVDWVVGNSHKTQISEIVSREWGGHYHGQIHIGDIRAHTEFLSAPVEDAPGDRTRPNLKIQDGCNNVCTFCIIPSVRGRSRSAPADRVIEQVRSLSMRYREIVLSGINLGRWGRERGYVEPGGLPARLARLVKRLLDETQVERLRLSSVEPMDFSDELLQLMADSPRLAAHIHAPLQSGCDATLKRMKRRYRTRHYAGRLEKARALMPDAAIGADVMTGFPGETDAEFEESRHFIESMPFTYLHVFTYSERPGTPAESYAGSVPIRLRKERNAILRQLAADKNAAFRQRFIGRTLSVVTLEEGIPALSTNYLKVELAHGRTANQLIDIRIGQVTAAGLREVNPLAVIGA